MVEFLRQKGELEATRTARMNFYKFLIPKPQDWLKWLEDETELATNQQDKIKVKELFDLALKDYPASIDIWLQYLKFCELNTFLIEDLNTEYKKAAAFPAWNLQKGHLIFKNSAKIAALAAIPYTTRAKQEANFDDISASPFENFEQVFPQNLEKYIEAIQAAKFMNSTDKLTLKRVLFERALELESSISLKIWEDYLKFLLAEMKVSSIILSLNHRLIRSHPLNLNSWILLLENLELFNKFEEIDIVWNEKLPKFLLNSSHECFLSLQLARLDYLRRRGFKDELILAFQTAIYDEEQHFSQGSKKGEPIDRQGRLSRYFGQVLLSFGQIEKFRNVWQQILKQHAKEAAFWLEYLQLERVSMSYEVLTNGFKRAAVAVTDYPETIFYEWLQYEKQHGNSIQSLLDVRERIEKQRKILKEREIQRQQKENPSSRKRTRIEGQENQIVEVEVEVEVETNQKPPPEPSNQVKSASSAFNPDATLFVNNLPFNFTESDIKNHFNNLITKLPDSDPETWKVKSIRMHMNSSGKSFKGHATIEFNSQETANSILEKFNRQPADESGRPVFLAKYVSPLDQKKPATASKYESDSKTIYVSNLPVKETVKVENLFKGLTGIQQIRHVQGKQFAYVEFENENFAAEALKEIETIDKSIRAAFSNPPVNKQQNRTTATVNARTLLTPRSLSIKK